MRRPETCGHCSWAMGTGLERICLKSAPDATEDGVTVLATDPVCDNAEKNVGCDDCGACCREAFDTVPVGPKDEATAIAQPGYIRQYDESWRDLRRVPTACGTKCAALRGGDGSGPYRCEIYTDRPSPCRDLEVGSANCLYARRRVGLTVGNGCA